MSVPDTLIEIQAELSEADEIAGVEKDIRQIYPPESGSPNFTVTEIVARDGRNFVRLSTLAGSLHLWLLRSAKLKLFPRTILFTWDRDRGNYELILPGARAQEPNPPQHYSAAGIGRTNRFDVEIDDVADGTGNAQMSVTTNTWSFRFALTNRGAAAQLLSFLRDHAGQLMFTQLDIGSFHGALVTIVKDDEFADRFWLRATGDGQTAEFVLAADDLAEFTSAVAQAVEDLQN